jgi:hypothetical protein
MIEAGEHAPDAVVEQRRLERRVGRELGVDHQRAEVAPRRGVGLVDGPVGSHRQAFVDANPRDNALAGGHRSEYTSAGPRASLRAAGTG